MFNMILAAGDTKTMGQFLESVQQSLAQYGSIIISIIGVAMVIVGIYMVAKNLISHGKGQTSWVTAIALIIIGGAFAITGGWRMVGNFAKMGRRTINDYAEGKSDDTGEVNDPFEKGKAADDGV